LGVKNGLVYRFLELSKTLRISNKRRAKYFAAGFVCEDKNFFCVCKHTNNYFVSLVKGVRSTSQPKRDALKIALESIAKRRRVDIELKLIIWLNKISCPKLEHGTNSHTA
jgi:hypothetical protein